MRKFTIIFVLCLLFFTLLPPSASASFTIEDEKKLGKEFYEKLEKSKALSRNVQVNAYIDRLGEKIVAEMKKSPFEYHFYVINSSAINAFATPGGYVYVNRGLVNLAENESELAGVLSHEIAHVNARHVADIIEKSKKVNIASLAAVLAGAFLGGGGEVTAAVTGFSMAAATTMNLKYSREHEEEADRLGISYLTKAGYNGKAVLDFLRIMRQYEFFSSSVPSYFLTHPGTDERIRYIDALLQTTYTKGGASDLFGQFKRVQTILALEGGRAEANLKRFQTALQKNPNDVDYLYGLAVTQDKLGQTSQSLDNFRRALDLAPRDEDILRDLGIAYYKNGRPAEAVNYLTRAVQIDGENFDALYYLGQSYEAVGNYRAAVGIYEELTQKQPENADVHYSLAVAYGRTEKPGESHYHFGIYFRKKNKMESALFHLREALKYFPPASPMAKDIKAEIKKAGSSQQQENAG